MNPSDCPLYNKCNYVKKCGDKMCPQDECGEFGRYVSRLQGAREFKEWLISKYGYATEDIEKDFAEWQKQQ